MNIDIIKGQWHVIQGNLREQGEDLLVIKSRKWKAVMEKIILKKK